MANGVSEERSGGKVSSRLSGTQEQKMSSSGSEIIGIVNQQSKD
jgi:hypothetical protein